MHEKSEHCSKNAFRHSRGNKRAAGNSLFCSRRQAVKWNDVLVALRRRLNSLPSHRQQERTALLDGARAESVRKVRGGSEG
eukprot:657196-Hanusia_phi.AAC.1